MTKEEKMKPLDSLKYIIRNKKKSFSVIACIAAAVFLLYSFQIMLSSIPNSGKLISLTPLEKYSTIYPNGTYALSDYLVSTVRTDKNVARVVPAAGKYTMFSAVTLSSSIGVYEMDIEDIKYYMNALGLKLKEGRLPQHSKDEIILDYRLANNKKLKLGDTIGSDIDRNEHLEGKYKIVGITEGGSICALTLSDKSIDKEKQYSFGMIVFPKKGKEEEVHALFENYSYLTSITSFSSAKEEMNKQLSTANMTINIIAAIIIVSMAISVGNICYVHFFERRKEFGILNALGYPHNFIIKRAFYEISFMNFIGFSLGFLLSIIVGTILKVIFLSYYGLTISLISKAGLVQCLCIPISTTILALKPISFMIKRIDAVTMIEGVK